MSHFSSSTGTEKLIDFALQTDIMAGKSDEQTESSIIVPSKEILNDGIAGKKVFGFQTPKRKSQLQKLVLEATKTPTRDLERSESTSRTPVNKTVVLPHKTPRRVRKIVSKGIDERMQSDSESEDFSGTDSDYKPSDIDYSSEEQIDSRDENLSSEDESENQNFSKKPKERIQFKFNSKSVKDDYKYILKPDRYFSSTDNKTSNNTLRLISKLSDVTLSNHLMSCNIEQSEEHKESINGLVTTYCNDFDKWMMLMLEGFNILLYGLGTKRNILLLFQQQIKKDPVLVINGFFPSLNLKNILDNIIVDLLEETAISNVKEAVAFIVKTFPQYTNSHLYIIVHNLEGSMLTDEKSQSVLSTLANVPNIHVVASIDHINSPLVWNDATFTNYNFICMDCTTFLPYVEETSFENSLLVQKSEALAFSSMTNVFQSLTKNSKGIFSLLVQYQLNKSSQKYYQGMPFKVLYTKCREQFLVSSDLALRAQLTEFIDHKLVKSSRSADGTETLLIPINNSLLQKFKNKSLCSL